MVAVSNTRLRVRVGMPTPRILWSSTPTSRGGLPADAMSVNTPLKPTEFAALLREHPDLRVQDPVPPMDESN